MTDDLLDRATRAFKNETAPDDDGADAVLARLDRTRRPVSRSMRRVTRVAAFTLAAALVGAAAAASVSERVRRLIVDDAGLTTRGAPTTAPVAPSVMETPPVEAPAPTAAPPVVETPGAVTAIPSRPTDAGVRRVQRPVESHASAPTAVPADVPPPQTTDAVADEDALYRAAHDAHFRRRDYAAAVVGWDRYLAVAGPGSRMLIEARYNRGIALARLGRTDDAIRALEPFASGDYGQYRRQDAERIIEALRRH